MTRPIDLSAERKSWMTLVARFCLRGYELHRLTGCCGYRISMGAWSADFPGIRDVLRFAERAGVDLE